MSTKNSVSKVSQGHLNKQLPHCPLCGCRTPDWAMGYDPVKAMVKFRCTGCDTSFSVSQTDFLGVNKMAASNNIIALIYLWPVKLIEGIRRFFRGQKLSTVYIKIDKLGYVPNSPFREGEDIPLEQMQQLIRSSL